MTFALFLDEPNPLTSTIRAMEPIGSMLALVVGALAGIALFGGVFLLVLALRRPRPTIRATAAEIVTTPPYANPPVPRAPFIPTLSRSTVPLRFTTGCVGDARPATPAMIATDETGPASVVIMASSIVGSEV